MCVSVRGTRVCSWKSIPSVTPECSSKVPTLESAKQECQTTSGRFTLVDLGSWVVQLSQTFVNLHMSGFIDVFHILFDAAKILHGIGGVGQTRKKPKPHVLVDR